MTAVVSGLVVVRQFDFRHRGDRDFIGRPDHLGGKVVTSHASVLASAARNGKPRLRLALGFVLNWVHSHWHLVHWGDVSAYLGVIVTAVFGFLAYRSKQGAQTAKGEAETAKGEAKAQAERAERATKAAQDAAAAADRAAEAAERSAKAHETQTQLMQDQADAAQQKPWDIERHGGMDFRLRNRTRTPKYDVEVTGEPTGRNPNVFRPGGGRHENSLEMVDGAETVELDLFVAAQTQERWVMVSWRPTRDHTGDPWTQRIGLP